MARWVYEVQVVGTVSENDLARIGAEVGSALAFAEPATTIITGNVADQSALVGLLDLMHALGLEVRDIRRVPDLNSEEGAGNALEHGPGVSAT